jgi:hypothetical protein
MFNFDIPETVAEGCSYRFQFFMHQVVMIKSDGQEIKGVIRDRYLRPDDTGCLANLYEYYAVGPADVVNWTDYETYDCPVSLLRAYTNIDAARDRAKKNNVEIVEEDDK